MIPQRILIRGFLSYRDEQEVHFDDGTLWMLAGPNGSGKSAVFDAVTYALFGQHRGGRQNARELVNKDSDRLVVEFDFLLENERYQARRTLRRDNHRVTRQLSRWSARPGEVGTWEAIADTTSEEGFGAWVRDHLGFTFETFTSSVLLLQGKAEKLLAAEPAERFRVLAGIVDLGRYERLHNRAEERRREFEATADILKRQLEAYPEVADAEIEDAAERMRVVQKDRDAAQEESLRLQRIEVYAEHWSSLQAKRALFEQQIAQATAQVERASDIERAWARLQSLRSAWPALETIVGGRERLVESATVAATQSADRAALADQLCRLDHSIDATRRLRDESDATAAEVEAQREAVAGRLRERVGLVARADGLARQHALLASVEAALDGMPEDLDLSCERLLRGHAKLTELSRALPALGRLHDERLGVHTSQAGRVDAEERAIALAHEANVLAASLEALMPRVSAASSAHRQARDDATAAKTRWQAASAELEQFLDLQGARLCRHCGQALTAAHFEAEKSRRQRDGACAEAAARAADQVCVARAQEEEAQQHEKECLESQLHQAQKRAESERRQAEQAERDACRHRAQCAQAFSELPAWLAERIVGAPGEWLVDGFPTAGDLEALRKEAAGADACRQALIDAQELRRQRDALRAQAESLRGTLEAEPVPTEIAALRAEVCTLEAAEGNLAGQLSSCRERLRASQYSVDRLTEERKALARRLADIDHQHDEQRRRSLALQEAIAQARGVLPAEWQAQADNARAEDLACWRAEREALEADNVQEQARLLAETSASLLALGERSTEVEREQASLPEDARCDPVNVRASAAAAQRRLQCCAEALDQARQEHGRLVESRERPRRAADEFRKADRCYTLYRTLADRLGRKGLQLHLLRRAEGGILDFANAILDRLCGGRFSLRGRGTDGEAEQVLELEAYDRQSRQAIGLTFLSGSQRFRVAVSLALGIGQYASNRHRPIESVIIDEGFGCLDREGRQVMIQELQNLRNQLRCILLVSHQEEFADAFSDGYRFELTGGTTAVTRFQR